MFDHRVKAKAYQKALFDIKMTKNNITYTKWKIKEKGWNPTGTTNAIFVSNNVSVVSTPAKLDYWLMQDHNTYLNRYKIKWKWLILTSSKVSLIEAETL